MFYTDYPILELGDTPNQQAPIRECEILFYDGDKYVEVKVCGKIVTFKRWYVYLSKGRLDEVPAVPYETLIKFNVEPPY